MSEIAVADRDVGEDSLGNVVFDLMPSAGFEDALTHLPDGETVAITLDPTLGIEPTIKHTEQAVERGYIAIPHIAPRFIEDNTELNEIAEKSKNIGISNIFVPGGDRDEPIEDFASSYEMLVALDEMGHEFEEVGIAGYPTGHESIDDATLTGAMDRKAPYATYITTQLTFESTAILNWISKVRDQGVSLPVEVGVPGVMDYLRLLRLSWRWGIADPIRFVRKTMGVVELSRRLVRSGGKYKPDEMVAGLAPYHDDQRYNIRGTRLYTFNQTADTEQWRRKRLEG